MIKVVQLTQNSKHLRPALHAEPARCEDDETIATAPYPVPTYRPHDPSGMLRLSHHHQV